MQAELNGRRLWFDVDGPALVPNGAEMRERPSCSCTAAAGWSRSSTQRAIPGKSVYNLVQELTARIKQAGSVATRWPLSSNASTEATTIR